MKLDLEEDEIIAILRAIDNAMPKDWGPTDPGLILINKIAMQVAEQKQPKGGVVRFDLRTN